jgi:hypothetical protein
MNDHGGVLRPRPMGFERDDCREYKCGMSIDRLSLGRSVARLQGVRPDQLLVGNHFQIAAKVGEFFAFGRSHHRAENAARTQIDFAIDRLPGCRREPMLEILWRRPRGPNHLWWDVDRAFQYQVKFPIGLMDEPIHGVYPLR